MLNTDGNIMKINLIHKVIYGRDAFYPHCEMSLKIATLLSQKTFTLKQIQQIEALGFIVNIQPQPTPHPLGEYVNRPRTDQRIG